MLIIIKLLLFLLYYIFIDLLFLNCNYRCGFMYGELTDKETVARLEYTLENQQQDQFEILLYKKNSKSEKLSGPRDFLSYPKHIPLSKKV